MIWQRTLFGSIMAIALMTGLLTTGPWANASPWRARLWGPLTCDPIANCPKDCCRDNYCQKPLPCPPPGPCLGCDDYCRKPQPCPQGPCRWLCDDYCAKPLPLLCCPPCEPFYKCGPGNWCIPLGATPIAPSSAPADQRLIIPRGSDTGLPPSIMNYPAMPSGSTPLPPLSTPQRTAPSSIAPPPVAPIPPLPANPSPPGQLILPRP